MKEIISKKHRLDKQSYIGRVRVTLTICIEDKKILFNKDEVVNHFKDILKKELEKQNIVNYVYSFMPDHLHLINEGQDEKSDLLKSLDMFKQRTGYWLYKNRLNCKWQISYYDYIHRKEDKLIEHIKYILDNPARKGLVKNWSEYKYSGSLHFDLEDLLNL